MADQTVPADQGKQPESYLFPVIRLPIEGHTVWPNIMRLMLIGSIVTAVLLSLAILIMLPAQNLQIKIYHLVMVLGGTIFFEMIVVRHLIIPLNGDYGRYRVNATNVEYYPLSALGMSVMKRIKTIAMGDFKGVDIQPTIQRDGLTQHYVVLSHPKQSNSIRLRIFNSYGEANNYADALSAALSVSKLRK